MNDDVDLQRLAEAEYDIQRFAAGEVELAPVEDPDEAAHAMAQLPPADAPHVVIRPLRMPFEVDATIRELAAQRGISISAMYRDLITSGLAATTEAAPDPIAELRSIQAAAQRALDRLAGERRRDAA
ncbi:hypothetical protein [Dactylosporangium sp. CS-033363]|uniref:hypothetical protein n=1 Tax=Dactylosporangium sp. CS-033363 TaxID=3239935 RepID=UPI003D8C11AF